MKCFNISTWKISRASLIIRPESHECDNYNLQQINEWMKKWKLGMPTDGAKTCLVWIYLDAYDVWRYLCDDIYVTIASCLVVGLWLGLEFRIRFSVWLVSGYAHVFVRL